MQSLKMRTLFQLAGDREAREQHREKSVSGLPAPHWKTKHFRASTNTQSWSSGLELAKSSLQTSVSMATNSGWHSMRR